MNLLPDEEPPVFKSWNTWYLVVIGFLALLIVLFFLFTKHFS
jgi:hypothetical protein